MDVPYDQDANTLQNRKSEEALSWVVSNWSILTRYMSR